VVNAHQAKTTQEAQICQDDQLEESTSKPSKKMPTLSKVKSEDNNADLKGNEEFCRMPKTTSETDNSGASDEDFTDANIQNGNFDNLEESLGHQSEGGNQDSHDFNFSFQLNTGGGASSESGGTFSDTNVPSSTEPEIFSPTPSQGKPDVESNFEKPSKPSAPSPKPQPKKPIKPKLINEDKKSKHSPSKQLKNRSSIPPLKPMKEGIRPPKQIKLNRSLNRSKKKDPFGYNPSKIPSQSHPFYNRKHGQQFKRGHLTYPASFRQNQFRPRSIFRPSTPRNQRIHRLHH
jgi:hypothetical protein